MHTPAALRTFPFYCTRRFVAAVLGSCALALSLTPTSRSLAPLVAHAEAQNLATQSVTIGSKAPDFSLLDANGTPRTLFEFRGKRVVLEWYNSECPFVKKFYSDGAMQKLQQSVLSAGDVWLTINSSAPGRQGHITRQSAASEYSSRGLRSTALLLDPTGEVGRRYGARTTPHMFVIDAAGTVAYAGAIDNRPSTDPSDIPTATNYVLQALEALRAGKPVAVASTEPYGCGVKYAG